jgi:Ion channel
MEPRGMLEKGDILFVGAAVLPFSMHTPVIDRSTGSSDTRPLTGHKFFLLFLFLLAILVFYPYVQNGGFGYLAFRVFGGVGILIAVYAIRLRRTLLLVALLLAIPAMLERLLLREPDPGLLSILSIVFSFVFDVFIVVVIFRRVFANDRPNSETIFGALCIYLLVGFAFASLYGMEAAIQPKAFYLDPRTNLHTVPNKFDFIYYSFATMVSLGAGGITAVSAPARSLSVIEAITGVLYLAVLIARLMGAYRYSSTSGGS